MRQILAVLFFGVWAFFPDRSQAAQPDCKVRTFEGSRFVACTFDSRRQELRLAWTGPDGHALRGFDKLKAMLGPEARRIDFAMNAGMFEENGSPLGLYIENGRTRRPLNRRNGAGNFYMKPNGIFALDANGTLHIDATDAFASRRVAPAFATQSGPMLVTAGTLHSGISPDGPSQNIRNGVGIRDAHTAIFAISDDPVSFGKLARFLRDDLGCRDALYLDGAISSAWIPEMGRQGQAAPLGPMIVVLDKR
jgi:uncharacterized protein YigE (DUF2233 family)